MKKFRFACRLTEVAIGVLLITAAADGQATTRVSVDSSGVEGNEYSYRPSCSADGRYVAFSSYASNLVPGDTNGTWDAFVHDRWTGLVERVSVDSAGVEGNGASGDPTISADGQVVAFLSWASNLVAGDTYGFLDVFVHDRASGITERVSVRSSGRQAKGNSFTASISADGQCVAFASDAHNLVAADTNDCTDVFVHERSTGRTKRVSVDSAGLEGDNDSDFIGSSISADGRIVAFHSIAMNLVAADTNGARDVFTHDRATGLTVRVSVDSSGVEGNGSSGLLGVSVSADGQTIGFYSEASNLVAGDGNRVGDVFVHDRSTGSTERVSVDSSGAEGNDYTVQPAMSADGRLVAFESRSSNLVAGDTNGVYDVFVHDRGNGTTERVSVDSSGAEANNGSAGGTAISADGTIIGFTSGATNLVPGDTNGWTDVFVRCNVAAVWSNYGAGWPGTLGVPTMVPNADPALGASVTITISNSLGLDTPALVILGLAEANVPTSKDGTLLVSPLLFTPLLVPIAGYALVGTVPTDPLLCGLEIDLQTLEVDAGASKGLSFTDGLKLLLGH